MRIKTKLAETPPGPSAEPRRARPGSKASPNAKTQLVEPGDAARAGSDDRGVVRTRAAPHPPPAWEAPPKTWKSGGVWVRARRIMRIASYALVCSCPAAPLSASLSPPFCYCLTLRGHGGRALVSGQGKSAVPLATASAPSLALDESVFLSTLLMRVRKVLAVVACTFRSIGCWASGVMSCGAIVARAWRAVERTYSRSSVGFCRLRDGPYACGGTARNGGMRVSC